MEFQMHANNHGDVPDGPVKNYLDDPKLHKVILGIIVLVLGYFGYQLEVPDTNDNEPTPIIFDDVDDNPRPSDEGDYNAVTLDLPPVAKITGPSGGETGNILILDASDSTGEFFAWSCDRELPGGVSILPSKDDTGKYTRCQVASVAGVYRVTLAVSTNRGVAMTHWVVTVRGPPAPDCPECPEPDDDIKPKPEPDDDIKPEPEPDISETAREVFELMKVTGVDPAEAHAVAGIIRNVAFRAAASGWDVQQLHAEYKKYFLATVRKENAGKWGGFMRWQSESFKPIATDKNKIISLLIEAADGLERVK